MIPRRAVGEAVNKGPAATLFVPGDNPRMSRLPSVGVSDTACLPRAVHG